MATEKDNIRTQSTSAGAISSPTVTGSASMGLGVNSKRIVDEVLKGIQSAGADNSDFALKSGLNQIESQRNAIRDTKGLIGLGALQSLGDLRNKVFENERERRIKQAEGGFAGGIQGVASQKAFNERIGTSANTLETDFLNKERSQNLQMMQLDDQMLAQARGSNAMTNALSREILRREAAGQGDQLYKLVHDGSFLGLLGGLFGKDQTFSGRLSKERFAQDEYFKSLMSDLGVDINDPAIQNRIAEHLKKNATGKIEMIPGSIPVGVTKTKDMGMTAEQARALYTNNKK